MSDALIDAAKEAGKPPIIYSICNWGWQQVWLWGKEQGQSWRTTQDIEPKWSSISYIINNNSFITYAADFYGHNDLDMLQLGNGDLDYEESKSHFTAWALMKSPLLIGTDLTKISNETLQILTNPEILAINQDPVIGTSISPFRWGYNRDWTWDPDHPAEFWSGRSQNGTVIMIVRTGIFPFTDVLTRIWGE
jgi:alpha-galactosidase